MIRSSVSATSTWMPPVVPESMVVRQSPLNTKIVPNEDQVFECPTSSASPTSPPENGTIHDMSILCGGEPDDDGSSDDSNDAGLSLGSENSGFSKERSALVLDNYTIAKWYVLKDFVQHFCKLFHETSCHEIYSKLLL